MMNLLLHLIDHPIMTYGHSCTEAYYEKQRYAGNVILRLVYCEENEKKNKTILLTGSQII
jgi:hypothetical protein